MSSVFVRELEEFGKRLEADGYPTAIVERAAERMQQLEDLVIKNDQDFQRIGVQVRDVRAVLKTLAGHPLLQEQAE